MDKQSRQQALDNISADDLAKINAHQAKTKGAFAVDDEWLLVTEFALKFGWQAYLDVKDDLVATDEMLTLLEASRKLDYLHLYKMSQASFIGTAASAAKKPGTTFERITRNIIKQTKADE